MGLDAPALIAALTEGPLEATLTLAEYEAELASTPADFRQALAAAWGEPAEDRNAVRGAFRFRFARLGKLIVAVQPDRGDASSRKGGYHGSQGAAAPRLCRVPLLAHAEGAGGRDH